jgi:hypothetical protein
MQGAVWNPLLLFLFGQIWKMIEKDDGAFYIIEDPEQ